MRNLSLGLAVAGALLLVLWSALWIATRAAPRTLLPSVAAQAPAATHDGTHDGVGTAATNAVGLILTATVGTDPNACATGTTAVIRANTPVYLCFTVLHIGTLGDPSLILHRIETARQGVITDALALNLAAGGGPLTADLRVADTPTADVTGVVTWTASTAGPLTQTVIANAFYTVDLVGPAVDVTLTVGQSRSVCPSTQSLRIPSSQSAFYCLTVINSGDVALTRHELSDPALSINGNFNLNLAPGERLAITADELNRLGINGVFGRTSVTSRVDNTVNYRGFTATNLEVSDSSAATVDVGTTTVLFTKTVSLEPNVCAGGTNIDAIPGQQLYYCVFIHNTGVVTLTRHQLTEQFLSIDLDFNLVLPPGGIARITNATLAELNQPIVFGPFVFDPLGIGPAVNNTMFYVGTSPEGFSVTSNSATLARIRPTPVPTRTRTPEPTATWTPFPSPTASNTPIPLPPTETPTPTWTPETPTPTPTRSYAISSLATPTPRGQAFDTQQLPPQPQDPFAQPQDPNAVIATQIALDATSTAIAAEATAAQMAWEAQFATATALAIQAPPPAAELPTPLPPLQLPPDSSLPSIQEAAPALEPTLTPTPQPPAPENATGENAAAPAGTLVPSGTPGVLLLVATATPAAAAVVPEGQRPIVPPTPTPTADALLAAARSFDAAAVTLGWLWFLVGSLIFFVSAGVVVGLFFRQAERDRFALYTMQPLPEEEPPPPPTRPRPSRTAPPYPDEDEWPSDLP